jgi:hypothetical protein
MDYAETHKKLMNKIKKTHNLEAWLLIEGVIL